MNLLSQTVGAGVRMSILRAFTTQQIIRLAKVSERQLRYWEVTDVFNPTYVAAVAPGPYKKIYAFRDLITLRTLGLLRNVHEVPLHELRVVSTYLSEFSNEPWSELGLQVQGKHVAFLDPSTGKWVSAVPLGQRVMLLDLEEIHNASEREVCELFARSSHTFGKITRHRNVMSNAWIIAGTRIPVEAVRSLRKAGATSAEVLQQYPTLVAADINAAEQFDPAQLAA